MNIAVFGATGGTGRNFLQQALPAGHRVTTLVRDPTRLSITHEQLTAIQGDVLDPEKVAKTLAGAEAVVVTLGNTPNNPELVCSMGTQNIVQGMQTEGGAQRLIVVTSLGVGDSADQVPFFFKMLMKTALRGAMADKEKQEAIVRESGLEWIIVRPGGLTDDPATGKYRVGRSRISSPAKSLGQIWPPSCCSSCLMIPISDKPRPLPKITSKIVKINRCLINR